MISISTIKINLVLFFISLAYYCISTFVKKKRISKKGNENMGLQFILNQEERIEGTNLIVRTLSDKMVQTPSYVIGKVNLTRKLVVEVFFTRSDSIDEDYPIDQDVTEADLTFMHLIVRQSLLQPFDKAQIKCTKVSFNAMVLPVTGENRQSLMSSINIFEGNDAMRRINEDIVLVTRFPEVVNYRYPSYQDEEVVIDDGQSD